jgi:hypothetical protein
MTITLTIWILVPIRNWIVVLTVLLRFDYRTSRTSNGKAGAALWYSNGQANCSFNTVFAQKSLLHALGIEMSLGVNGVTNK